MTMMKGSCPQCGSDCTVPVEAVAVRLIDEPVLSAEATWICLGCGQLVAAPTGLVLFVALVDAGAWLIPQSVPLAPPAHPENPPPGPRFDLDDVIAMHEALLDDSWFSTLIGGTSAQSPSDS